MVRRTAGSALQTESGGRSVELGGDGRADSPGHYMAYTAMDLVHNKVLDVQIVQCNEPDVGNSSRMEQKGLERRLNFLSNEGIDFVRLVTDRHPQVTKFMREQWPDVSHNFYIWHVAKGLQKKLHKMAMDKRYTSLAVWIKSIINQLYWSATSTDNDQGELVKAKWISVINHIADIHDDHPSELFPTCLHGDLYDTCPTGMKNSWLAVEVTTKLETVLCNERLLKDVEKLATGPQTSSVECFNSLVNHFAPKSYHFSNRGMNARVKIAALHYNENANRKKALTADGEERYSIHFPKGRKGGHVVRAIKEEASFDYLNKIMERVFTLVHTQEDENLDLFSDTNTFEGMPRVPPPMCSVFHHPEKRKAVEEKVSRFKKTKTNFQK